MTLPKIDWTKVNTVVHPAALAGHVWLDTPVDDPIRHPYGDPKPAFLAGAQRLRELLRKPDTMKPNPHDPHHITLSLVQNLYGLGMQRDEEIAKLRADGLSIRGELSSARDDLRSAHNALESVKMALGRIAEDKKMTLKWARGEAIAALKSIKNQEDQ